MSVHLDLDDVAATSELAKTQLGTLRALLCWAITFVVNETDALAQCHENPETGELPADIAAEVAAAREWVREAKEVVGS